MTKSLNTGHRIEFLLKKIHVIRILAAIIFLFNLSFSVFAQDEAVSQDEIDEIKKNITKAGTVNKAVKLDGGVDIGRDLTQFKNNPTKNNPTPRNSLIESSGTSLSIGITTKPEASTSLRVGINLAGPMDGTYKRTLSIYESFQVDIKTIVANNPFIVSMGGIYYDYACSPLTLGFYPDDKGIYLFERASWYDVTTPEAYYKSLYNAGGALVTSRQGSPGLKGFYFNYNYSPIGVNASGFYGKPSGTLNNASWLWYGKLEKTILGQNIAFQYASFNMNVYNTQKNDEEQRLVAVRSSLENYYLEVGYSKATKPKTGEKADGIAMMLRLFKNIKNLFFFNGLSSQFRFYYASSDYRGMHNMTTAEYAPLNAVTKTRPVFTTDTIILISPPEHIGQFFSNRFSLYFANMFNFLLGKVKITLGQSRDLKETPNKLSFHHHLGHIVWNGMVSDLAAAGYPNLGQEWVDDSGGGAYESVEIFYHGKNIGPTRKTYPLLRFDLAYDLKRWFNLGIPLFYFGKIIDSAISTGAMKFPMGNDIHNVLEYNFQEHFLALGISAKTYLIGFVSTEDQRAQYLGDEFLKMHEIGRGIGLDCFITGNFALYLRYRYFEHTDIYRTKFDFNGYTFSVSVSRRL